MVLLAVVIITAVTGAFAAKKKFDCYNQPQYYQPTPGNYTLTGTFGVNYYCQGGAPQTCTYILNPFTQQFEPCRVGLYSIIIP